MPWHTSRSANQRKKAHSSLLNDRLEYARQRAEHPQPPDLTTTAPPEILPLDTLLATPLPAPTWVIPDLLPVGITFLIGKPHVGKSWLAMRLALAIANATPALERWPVARGHTLYLGLEDNRENARTRASDLLAGQDAPHALEWADKWLPLNAGGLADIEDWLDAHPEARMVVIDSFTSVHSQDERRYSTYSVLSRQDATILIPLNVIAAMHQVAILIILHLYKTAPTDAFDDVNDLRSNPDIANCMLLYQQERNGRETILRITGHSITEKEMVVQ